jgi:uncharacterized membrane protein
MTTTRVRTKPQWRVPAALLAAALVPVAAGALRVAELAGGPTVTAGNARFVAAPVPILLHIVGATAYCVVGAFQFVPVLRRKGWHRRAGRWIVLSGLVTALSAGWMVVTYPHPPGDGALLDVFRLVFAAVLAGALVAGVAAIRRRDVVAHRGWMVRAYAVGMGGSTQGLVIGVWMAAVGAPDEVTRALLLGAGWVVNLAVGEWIVRRRLR